MALVAIIISIFHDIPVVEFDKKITGTWILSYIDASIAIGGRKCLKYRMVFVETAI